MGLDSLEFFTYELLFDNLNSAFANVKDANNFRLLVGLARGILYLAYDYMLFFFILIGWAIICDRAKEKNQHNTGKLFISTKEGMFSPAFVS